MIAHAAKVHVACGMVGTPRKLLDVSRLRDLGWQARIPLREGIALACRDFLGRFAG